ncbi:MAG: hypothetical protein AB7Q64_08520 [Verrucomicrobiales bacterium]
MKLSEGNGVLNIDVDAEGPCGRRFESVARFIDVERENPAMIVEKPLGAHGVALLCTVLFMAAEPSGEPLWSRRNVERLAEVVAFRANDGTPAAYIAWKDKDLPPELERARGVGSN